MSRPVANRVRIIGGSLRGRLVPVARDRAVRPTPDRVRETLFNWLGQDLSGRQTLELYAGTGVLSLEALSRGANLAVAVDLARGVVEALRTTASNFGLPALETHVADARGYLTRETRFFDVIFLDPPFAEDPWSWLLPACVARAAQTGYVYAEAPHELAACAGLTLHRAARAGQVHYHLFAKHDS